MYTKMFGKYYSKQRLQEWYEEQGLPFAKELIQKYPNINAIFNGLDGYEKKNYQNDKNIILLHFLPDFNGKVRPENIPKLNQIEAMLTIFNIPGWKKKRRQEFLSKLTSARASH